MPKKNIWVQDKQSSSRPAGTTHTQYQYTDLYQISTLIPSKFPAIRSPLLLAGSAKSDGDSVCTHKKKTTKNTKVNLSHLLLSPSSAKALEQHLQVTRRTDFKRERFGARWARSQALQKAVLISWLQKENRKKTKKTDAFQAERNAVYIYTHII